MPTLAKMRPLIWQRLEGVDCSISSLVSSVWDTFEELLASMSLAQIWQLVILDLGRCWTESIRLPGQNIGAPRVTPWGAFEKLNKTVSNAFQILKSG